MEDICWDLAEGRQDREVGLAICMVHRENAEPTRGLNGLGGFRTQVSHLGNIGDDVIVGYFYAFWYPSGTRRAV